MTELDDLLGQLKRFWAEQGLACGRPAESDVVRSFEEHYEVCLPEDLREYFGQVNGMTSLSEAAPVDDNDITFYPLNEVTPDAMMTGEHGRLFTFADFLISSHDYAVELATASQQSGVIYALNGTTVRLADTFSIFLRRYLVADPAILYPWGKV